MLSHSLTLDYLQEENNNTMNSSRSSKTNSNSNNTVRHQNGSGSDVGHTGSTASNSTTTTPRSEHTRHSPVQENCQSDEERQKQVEKAYRPILPAGMFHEPHSKSGISTSYTSLLIYSC